MKITKNLGMLTLAIYLILVGLSGVLGLHLGQFSLAVPVAALVAGLLILAGR